MSAKTSNNDVIRELFKTYPIDNSLTSGELIDFYYKKYLEIFGSNNSRNGTILEELIVIALLRAGISPIYTQATMAFVPNVIFDILIYNRKTPVCISSKVSLRERWKQADIEAMALKYVHRKAKAYVFTLAENEVRARRKDENSYVGIDEFILADTQEFDELVDKLRLIDFTESESIEIIQQAEKKLVNLDTIKDKYNLEISFVY
jgi:hypothetical protein